MSWLKGCVACNIGIIEEMDRFVEKFDSELKAAKELHKQQMEALGEEVYSVNSILQRYRYHTNKKKVCQNDKQVTTAQNDNTKGAGQGNVDTGQTNQEWPYCSECKHKPVEKNSRNRKPHSSGMCRTCRRNYPKNMAIKKAKEEFEKIPIDQEADRFWKEFAENLNNVSDNIGEEKFKKISMETLLLLNKPMRRFDKIFKKVCFKTDFVQK